MTLTLKDYRQMSLENLIDELKYEKGLKKFWLGSMSTYQDRETGYYDGYNYNRCRNEAIKIETRIKRIIKVLEEIQ